MQTGEPEIVSEERGQSRAAILAAARLLAERDGVESLTLGKVAAEAGLPRPAIYGQFVRKEDLLLCVAADSVATLARAMGPVDGSLDRVHSEEARESAVILSLARPAVDEQEQAVDAAQDVAFVAEAGAVERRVVNADANSEKSAARAPDAWLERRLRVFERAMTAMQTRQEQVEKESRAIVAKAEDSLKAMQEKVAELAARADEADARQKAAANELRAALNEASLRIQTVEGVAKAALLENETPHADVEPVEPEAPQPTADAAEQGPTEMQVAASEPSYLTAARASAIAAASVAVEPAKKKKPKTKFTLARALTGSLFTLVLFTTAAGVAFSQGVRDGRRDALLHVTRLASLQPAATPLDRLAARAQAGDPTAELAVATRYLGAAGSLRDPAAGLRWATRAAEHGSAVAQYLLGGLYQNGVGTPADPAKALRWYEAAALQGNRKAMHDLAVAYAQGLGGPRNWSEAARWFSRAAGFGYVDSQFDLAVLYERGEGVPLSLLDAYKWYAIAGAQGDVESRARIDVLRTQLSADDLAAAQHAADTFRPLAYDLAANLPPRD